MAKGEGRRGMGIDRAGGAGDPRGPVEPAGFAAFQGRRRLADHRWELDLVRWGSRGTDRLRPIIGDLRRAGGEGNR